MSDNVNLSKKLVTYEAMSVYDECIKQFIDNKIGTGTSKSNLPIGNLDDGIHTWENLITAAKEHLFGGPIQLNRIIEDNDETIMRHYQGVYLGVCEEAEDHARTDGTWSPEEYYNTFNVLSSTDNTTTSTSTSSSTTSTTSSEFFNMPYKLIMLATYADAKWHTNDNRWYLQYEYAAAHVTDYHIIGLSIRNINDYHSNDIHNFIIKEEYNIDIRNINALYPVTHTSSLDTITVNPNTCNIWTRPNSNTSCTLDINLHTVNNSKTIATAEVLLTLSNTKPDSIVFNTHNIKTYWLNGNSPMYDVNKMYKIHIEYIDYKYFCSYEEYPLSLTNKFELTPITAVSFNIKTAYAEQGLKTAQQWDSRKDSLLSFLHGDIKNANKYTMPTADIIGLQEIYMDGGTQWNDIKDKFIEYDSIIANRGSSSALIKDSEACAILYRKDRFTRVSGGYFWLRGGGWNGDTGNFNEEGKATWDAGKSYSKNYKRIAVWIILREKHSGKQIFVLNTHYNNYFLDDGTTPASTPYYSSELIKNRIDALSGSYPTIFMGDLHCNPDKSAIQILKPNHYSLRDTRDEAKEVLGEEYTMNDWDNPPVTLKINDDYEYHSQPTYALFDYVMVKDGGYGSTGSSGKLIGGVKWTVNQHIVPLVYSDKWLSDHNPVIADLYLE